MSKKLRKVHKRRVWWSTQDKTPLVCGFTSDENGCVVMFSSGKLKVYSSKGSYEKMRKRYNA